jgi:hypothetical protein
MKPLLTYKYAAAFFSVPLILIAATWDEPEFKADELGGALLRSAGSAPISVSDAVAIAERHTGGKVLEASYYYSPLTFSPIYALRSYQNGAVWEAMIDASTGQIVENAEITPREALEPEDRAEISGFQAATLTILDAIRLAERHANGKAVSVDFEAADAPRAFWEVSVIIGKEVRKLAIDPAPVKWSCQTEECRFPSEREESNKSFAAY